LKNIQKKKAFEEERKLNNNLGVMHQRLGKFNEAQEYLNKAIIKSDAPSSSA
jgi:Tfp pilus assembly protein PilF